MEMFFPHSLEKINSIHWQADLIADNSRKYTDFKNNHFRGGANENAGSRGEVQVVLANSAAGLQGGRQTRALSRAWHSARPADPEHGDHDGHLWAHCLPAQTAALLDEQLEITTFIQQSTLQYYENVFTLDRVAFVPFLDRPAHSRLSMKRRKNEDLGSSTSNTSGCA